MIRHDKTLDHPGIALKPRRKAGWMGAGLLAVAALGGLAACSTTPPMPPLALAPHVDLQRYMGDWYVIAVIPTFIEKNNFNAVESYRLDPDGVHVHTTFTFNEGAPDGPVKQYHPTGTVVDRASNAVWTMQFIWPFQADYRIMQISPDYQTVVIGREKRDYVWIMARTPTLPAAMYDALVQFVASQGYDVSKLRKVPQAG